MLSRHSSAYHHQPAAQCASVVISSNWGNYIWKPWNDCSALRCSALMMSDAGCEARRGLHARWGHCNSKVCFRRHCTLSVFPAARKTPPNSYLDGGSPILLRDVNNVQYIATTITERQLSKGPHICMLVIFCTFYLPTGLKPARSNRLLKASRYASLLIFRMDM